MFTSYYFKNQIYKCISLLILVHKNSVCYDNILLTQIFYKVFELKFPVLSDIPLQIPLVYMRLVEN